ncbi:MAG: hypothetical protein RBS10_11450 [Thauera propionica]|nr:hypothetical protein [Thauera propionica]
MAIGTEDKPAREARPGIYSAAISNFAAPFQTTPSAASRQTTVAMDQMLRNQAPPMGMPAVAPTRSARTPAAPTAPAAPSPAAPSSGPISQMAQAARSAPANATPPSMVQQAATQPRMETPQPGQQAELRRADLAGRQAAVQSILGKELGTGGPISQMAQAAQPDPMAGMRVSDTSVAGVRRVDGGSSPLFTNLDPALAVGQMRGGTLNTLPAASFGAGRGPVSTAAQQMQQQPEQGPTVGMIGGGTTDAQAALQQQIKNLMGSMERQMGRGRAGRNTMNALISQFQAITGAQQGLERLNADQANNAAGLDMRQQELAQRIAEGQQRLGLDRQRLGLEAPGAQGQMLQNQQSQMMLELTRKAIGGDGEALKQLQALQGKEPKNPQLGLLTELIKAWGQGAASGMGNGMPLATMLQEAGPILQMALGMPGATTPAPQQFVEGQTYLDASGNRARFVGGQWVEVE